jgi:hypothetical protein
MIMGEMGRSLFRHPDSYMKLISKYRGTLARGKVRADVCFACSFFDSRQCDHTLEMFCWLAGCWLCSACSSFRGRIFEMQWMAGGSADTQASNILQEELQLLNCQFNRLAAADPAL